MSNFLEKMKSNLLVLQFDTDRMSSDGREAYENLMINFGFYEQNVNRIEANSGHKIIVMSAIRDEFSNLFLEDFDRVSTSGQEALRNIDDAIYNELNEIPSLASQIKDASSEKTEPPTQPSHQDPIL